ncbi:MAG: peptidoglycan DD-metalloendopeptidase family protein [Gammaproteobacteria bacterium]|nr:peptidoglycan DD-metalloendopeptidase family protein [Gammaproteobacteria bacterium]
MQPAYGLSLLLTALIAFTLAVSPIIAADEKSQKEKQLKSLQKKIDKLKKTIHVKQDSKSRYTSQLRKIEDKIGKVSNKIRETEKKITQRKAELEKLRKTRKQHQQKLANENEILAEQVYTAYTLGKQEKIKLLFSQRNTEHFQRNLIFYQYFSNARANLIDNVQQSINEILTTESRISLASQALDKNYQTLKSQKVSLKEDSKKRKNIISSLDQQLKKQGGHLKKLVDDANELQNLLDSIEQILVDEPEPELEHRAFADMRGKLAWPVKGKLRQFYGKLKPLSDLRWQGVVIEAPTGRHVKAVSHGRVAFADWLRGLGNLIIIDHGNSYLSLYGHNESLFKTAGEWVEPGDIISSVGSSGGQESPGLYFEIRKKGKPQNPTKWCKSRNQFASG